MEDTTDLFGQFEFLGILVGNYNISLSLPNYRDTTINNIIVATNDTTIIDILLTTIVASCSYLPGDANASNSFNGLDVTYSLNYLKGFGLSPPIRCDCPPHDSLYVAADANGSCGFNGSDIVYMVNYLKGFGPAPKPCPDCAPTGR